MLTGLIDYNGKTCVFKLHKESFSLEIEDIEEREKLPFLGVAFGFNKEPEIELQKTGTLIAKDFEKGKAIHFHIKDVYRSAPKTYKASLISYIVFDGGETSFDGLEIQADELNWFHNISLAFEHYKYFEDGEGELRLKPFDKTTEEFEFNLKDKLIKGNLSIRRDVTKIATSPLKLNSTLNYQFEDTTDVSIANDLVSLTRQLLEFLSYRKNLHINRLILKKKFDHENYSIGELYVRYPQPEEKEEEKIIRERIISYSLLGSSFTNLLEKISIKKVYLRHIPENYKSKNTITPARFVMATAGFEWQFEISHKAKSEENKQKYEKERNEVLDFLNEKIEETTGRKEKKFFDSSRRFFEKNQSQLTANIMWALKDSDEVLKDFIKNAYSMNGIESEDFKRNVIAERIQKDRNTFAHGNLSTEFNKLIDIDLSVLEWLYYAMVLDDIGVSKENAKKCINDLFQRGFNYR